MTNERTPEWRELKDEHAAKLKGLAQYIIREKDAFPDYLLEELAVIYPEVDQLLELILDNVDARVTWPELSARLRVAMEGSRYSVLTARKLLAVAIMLELGLVPPNF